ncbi:MAG: PBP1A family penicillin-binding protein [Patescibacteria group bacterium]
MGEVETEIHAGRLDKIQEQDSSLYPPVNPPPEIADKSRFRHFKFSRLKKLINRRNVKLLTITAALVLIIIPVFTYIFFARDLADKASIMNRNNAGVKLLDDKGELFFSFYSPKNIDAIPLSQIPKDLQKAAIAAEDKDFYKNPGFSIRGIARAFFVNVKSASIDQGGSTITQQLVKNALLSSSRNVLRKYQEIILALEIERRYSKEDILEMYLNSVYFGDGAFGIENAAQVYFDKSAKDLNLAQGALLVAILPAPSALSPVTGDLEAAKKRQEIVLSKMVDQNLITDAQRNAAIKTQLTFAPPKKDDVNTIAPHFALMVKDYLINTYGEEKITRNGYVVKTTLNKKWQEAAQSTVRSRVDALAKNKATNGAAVAIDPKTGDIKMLVGSKDWSNKDFGKLNMVLAKRQPGSSFKPIIYERALEQKLITTASTIDDAQTSFGSYKPKNYDGKFRGQVTVRRALANSLNIPAIKVMEKVGVREGLDNAKKLGITSLNDKTDYGLPLVLGAGEVPLLEMTDAYATFANDGKYNKPNFILEIKDKKNKEIKVEREKEKSAVGEGPSFLISSILSDTSARAEVFGASLNTSRNTAVKTGTTEDYRDALTLGYTPSIAIGVWVGNNDNKPMDRVAGSLGAAPIFVTLMNTFSADLPKDEFRIPSSVVERKPCEAGPSPTLGASPSPTPASSLSGKEYYLKGTEPPACPSPSPTPTPQDSPQPTPTSQPTQEPSPTPVPASPSPSPTPSPSPLLSPLVSPILSPLPT